MPHYRLHRDPKSSHQQISRRVRALDRGPVLDVGAAQGMLGELLSGSGMVIDAVEPNPQWAQDCRAHYRNVMVGTVEDVPIPNEKYRVIVCADVLEHTADPVSVLGKIRRVAADDAIYLVSLPNVAHLAVRMMLLTGKFPKMERGILDKTHLQFFTRDTGKQMLEQAGLRVTNISATGVPLDEVFKSDNESLLQGMLTKSQHAAIAVLPRLFAMQFIFQAEHADQKLSHG
jgi:2-polyprenyl-3-methyl-5-hydroxy-6-metoxy-1,4-benzoquinol methylase